MIRRALLSREGALLGILALIMIGFGIFVDGFLDPASVLGRTRYWAAFGIIAVPMTFIIATAGIDLSVGSIVALSGITLGLLYQDAGWPIWAAAGAAVFVGAAAGAFNGAVSAFLRIPPLVVTLATMTLFRGIAMGLSKARSFSGFPEGFSTLGHGDVLPLVGGASLSVPLAALLVVMAVGALILRKSWIGRYTECIGENPTAAAFAAIPVRPLLSGLYTACGAVCGIAALFHTSLFNTAKADAAMGMELEAIACVVIGGTRISGGEASVLGTLLGLLIIGMLGYGLELAGMRSQYIVIVVGVLLVATAVFNEAIARRKGGRT